MTTKLERRRPTREELAHYDPVRGVLSIHAAKEAEKRARRARNIDEVAQAIEKKLQHQRDFILWWDRAAERRHRKDSQPGPGRGKKNHILKTGHGFLTPEDFGLTVKILSSWRTRLDDDSFPITLEHEIDHARRRLEFDVGLAEEQRQARYAKSRPPLPPGIFRVLYADPPWWYSNSGVIVASDNYGRAARHYPSLTIEELCALDIRAHVADDAVLFLWVTSPILGQCWPVIEAWGFQYKTSMVWDKQAHNFGHYVSVRHELLLICTRGSCLPDHPTPMPDSVISVPRSDVHSQKPEVFRNIIDQLYDGGAEAKLELFARCSVDGWTQYGNEIPAEVAHG
jgi:N6-adenosine-specific RNA methylase IME4